MRRPGAAGAAAVLGLLGAVAVPGAAGAAPTSGMVLECAEGPVLTRSNGASWWGLDDAGAPDGTGYVTLHLRVAGLDGQTWFEHSYGTKRGLAQLTCTALHGPFGDEPGSVWTVQLVRTR